MSYPGANKTVRRAAALALALLLCAPQAFAGILIVPTQGLVMTGADGVYYDNVSGLVMTGADGLLAFNVKSRPPDLAATCSRRRFPA